MSVLVIIPAAGKGARFGSAELPKQYHSLEGIPVIIHTLRLLEGLDSVDAVAVVVNPDYKNYLTGLLVEYGITKVKFIIDGGAERQESVHNAVKAGICAEHDFILVHDSVRPLATAGLFNSVISTLGAFDAVIPGVRPKDTVKQLSEGRIGTFDRNKLFLIQTPQGFRSELLAQAYDYASEYGIAGTDDSFLVEKFIEITKTTEKMEIIAGEETNIKITTAFDMELAGFIIAQAARTNED